MEKKKASEFQKPLVCSPSEQASDNTPGSAFCYLNVSWLLVQPSQERMFMLFVKPYYF